MQYLPAVASLSSFLACALWIVALVGPWYHAPNSDGTEQYMGLYGAYKTGQPHRDYTHHILEDVMGNTTAREHYYKYDHDNEDVKSEEENVNGPSTLGMIVSTTSGPTGIQPPLFPPEPVSTVVPAKGHDRHLHHHGHHQDNKHLSHHQVSSSITQAGGDGIGAVPPIAPPPGYGHENEQHHSGYQHQLENHGHGHDASSINQFPYNEVWVLTMRILLILAIIFSGIAALLQLLLAWAVGRPEQKEAWTASSTTAIITTDVIAFAGVLGFIVLFLFLFKLDQLPHGHFDYGYTLNVAATVLSFLSSFLFWFTLDTSTNENLLDDETSSGRQKYGSIE